MLSKQQAMSMLSLQYDMNSKVDPNWITASYPYLRAVVIEGSEAIEHHGWKWWKKQHYDQAQLQMELIDIWHFCLSELLLINTGDKDKTCQQLLHGIGEKQNSTQFDGQVYDFQKLDLVSKLELLIGISVARRVELKLFESIMIECGMNWSELFSQYVGKNVLNFFRQDHGYKEGSYLKIWNGKEDNEYLVEVLAALDPAESQYQQLIYQRLVKLYPNQV